LNELATRLGYDARVKISYQTLINHLCRVGLGVIQNQKRKAGQWVCVTDFTMNQGPVRVLPVLSIPVANMNRKKAITLKDVECLGVIPMVKARGSDIITHYKKLFENKGYPAAFLQDGGGNLRSAAVKINEQRKKKKLAKILIINDVGHFSANVVKKHFDKEKYMKVLLAQVSRFNLKVRITKYAYLKGPKLRTAGRYMGYMKEVLRWLYYLKRLSKGSGRPIEGSLREKILELFPTLIHTVKKLHCFIEVIEIEEFILTHLKKHGLNPKTHRSVKKSWRSFLKSTSTVFK
jgi:hypothetical protein